MFSEVKTRVECVKKLNRIKEVKKHEHLSAKDTQAIEFVPLR